MFNSRVLLKIIDSQELFTQAHCMHSNYLLFMRFLHKKNLFITLLSFLLLLSSAKAYASFYENHIEKTIDRTFDFTGISILILGGAAVAVTQPMDYATREANKDHQRMDASTSKIGDAIGMGIPGAVIALTQLLIDTPNGVMHTRSLITTSLVTIGAKAAGGRSRPGTDEHNSMPSGHSSTAFTSATTLTYSYGWWAAIPGYSLAVLTAASRLADDRHWLSDTVAGAALGILLGRATAYSEGSFAMNYAPLPGGGMLIAKTTW